MNARQKLLKRIADVHGHPDWVFDPNSWDADIQAVIDELITTLKIEVCPWLNPKKINKDE